MLHKEFTSKTQDIESHYADGVINLVQGIEGQIGGGGRGKQSGLCWVRFQEDILNIQNYQGWAKAPGGHIVKVTFQRS